MENNTNWGQSVAGAVIKEGKVLLCRHTYGAGKNMLIVPGGYVNHGESPQDALKREYMEEAGVNIEVGNIIGIRFNAKDWYIIFRAEYIAGDVRSDGDENSEVLWIDINEALARDDVPELTKKIIESAISPKEGLEIKEYNGYHPPFSLYSL